MKRKAQYQPLALRTLENFQIQHLARKFDFGKESRIARLIVDLVNHGLAEEEKIVGIQRVLPFELYIKRKERHLCLPLFHSSYLEPIYEGGTFADARKLVKEKCLRRLRAINPYAKEREILKIIDPWALKRRKGPTRFVDEIHDSFADYCEEDSIAWADEIDRIKPLLPSQRLETPDLSAPGRMVRKLVKTVSQEIGLGNLVAQQLVEEVIILRNICCPRVDNLKSGELPLLIPHVNAHLSEEIATQFRRHTPVIVTLWAPGEMNNSFRSFRSCIELLKKRITRVCFEAYRQNGLLSQMDLQWIFQISSARISELIRSFQKEHHIIVPTPGTVLDAGRSITHKDIIVRLHLDGYSVNEIARITYHSRQAADNYIGTFEAVLILKLYGVPALLIARALSKGLRLIQEYLKLIDEFYEDEKDIRNYLIKKGVNL